jgi:hypothetical protein
VIVGSRAGIVAEAVTIAVAGLVVLLGQVGGRGDGCRVIVSGSLVVPIPVVSPLRAVAEAAINATEQAPSAALCPRRAGLYGTQEHERGSSLSSWWECLGLPSPILYAGGVTV